ncbi:hypothetical protein LCGC14_2499340 [marine sediment metagenome]|uniref:Uncharacterized protein n=1 Tax=marine sediment metagenome TaxID=412755 RepID=A0A0F9B287_9ZZZZ
MEKPVRAFYKARITYKNLEWIDGVSTLEDMKYFLIKDVILAPPPNENLDVTAQHIIAQNSISHFWAGNIPVVVENDVFIHPNRIVKIEIVNNIEIVKVNKQSVVG